uniref:Uncharacterized protein n=1 Tax=Pseudo-nitzschia australis TaxID=44445 RepID=A0A6U9Z0Q7_9STRA|mmetsp:Transcript_14275/g.30237  ORF Transcript_14275/g.30237 Transcript_14275/m.30237 type:complete len:649 (-) Transcript_14275:240-2186(-)|eukprot:CAMPEP_0168175144 /NCGR_PEP_ID=MMETSP0139_2-20121125/6944_1 /TAXON_ID=44445 /ORGANISM="Pseudo-nitzschia australis, Strain 10249 10 AB" /LENGTH=648 /DNA_ID=CAMNT_0008093469 /DNA_START=230 /DNA_END=2176 /DNA_ORIENTATION=-
MTNQSTSSAAALLVLLSFLSSGVAAAIETCQNNNEQPLEFRFFTDNNSWKDNGWTLDCQYEDSSQKLLWETPIGFINREKQTEVIREAACVPDSATCTLRIYDASGDGLQGGNADSDGEAYTGWFAFLHGATTVGTYKSVEDPAFHELTYCVGPNCNKAPQEVQTNDEDCQDIVYLAMQLDNRPQDTTYQLICGSDSEVVWDGKDFTEAGAYVEEETCLPKDACCQFVVTDSDTNGLTAPVDVNASSSSRAMGYIYLERNYEPVLEYDGNTGQEFDVLSKTFGSCSADKNRIHDQQQTLDTTEEVKDNIVVVIEDSSKSLGEEYLEEFFDRDDPNHQAASPLDSFQEDVEENDVEDVEENDDEEKDMKAQDDPTTNAEKYLGQFFGDREKSIADTAALPAEEYLKQFFGERQKLNEDEDEEEEEQKASTSTDHSNDYIETANTAPITTEFLGNDYGGNGNFGDDFGDNAFTDDTFLTDDVEVWNTDGPTTWPTETAYPTAAPTEERNIGDLYDDVVENDDWPSTTGDDDIDWTKEQLQILEDMVVAADNFRPVGQRHHGHPALQKQGGMRKGAKIAVGICVSLLLILTVCVAALYIFRERLMERFGTKADDELIEKGTQAEEGISDDYSYNQDDLRSDHSLKDTEEDV